MKKRWKVITVVASTIAFTLIGAMWGPRENKPYVEAASKDSVKLRIIGTTDIHDSLTVRITSWELIITTVVGLQGLI